MGGVLRDRDEQGGASMSRQAVSDWMRGPAAARALGFETTKPVRRLAEKGLIGVLALPSAHPKYSRADVERLKNKSLKPAAAAG
jgi:hypothetical protein